MKSLQSLVWVTVAALCLAGCGDKPTKAGGTEPEGHAHSASHGGTLVETSDHSMHFEVKHDESAGLLQVWVFDGDMKMLKTGAPTVQLAADSGGHKLTGTAPGNATPSHEWHFTHKALEAHAHGRLRLEHGGKSYNVDLPDDDGDHDGHEHEESHGPHDGMVAAFAGTDGKAVGHVELKLHDDKGDLELWIATDEGIKTPFDLGADSEITVTFHGRDRTVTLRVRDKDQNADEDGTATMRAGKTNYFIYPGETGADASWLQGAEFTCPVSVTFRQGDATFTTKQFQLKPHGHGDHGHDHDDEHDDDK
ncbi:MAG: hypothetical protein O2894_03465 [Planctomycetota bacterium]|nr:hypothetical protein [Planctomycetota bacterium]